MCLHFQFVLQIWWTERTNGGSQELLHQPSESGCLTKPVIVTTVFLICLGPWVRLDAMAVVVIAITKELQWWMQTLPLSQRCFSNGTGASRNRKLSRVCCWEWNISSEAGNSADGFHSRAFRDAVYREHSWLELPRSASHSWRCSEGLRTPCILGRRQGQWLVYNSLPSKRKRACTAECTSARCILLKSYDGLPPLTWWGVFSARADCPLHSGSFSTEGAIHSKKRNKLSGHRVEKFMKTWYWVSGSSKKGSQSCRRAIRGLVNYKYKYIRP